MRIRTLTFRGVGPYLDEQHVDFDRLGDSGLYLINGPTGSGKSTLIDCICFALYGSLASDEADIHRMRSDFAGPADPTEVDLVFETASGVFRVIRSPEYTRAKKGGSGETVAKATCRLFQVLSDGHEEAIATNVSSANKELRSVVGLDRSQFVQTIVLPQGQFATFLYSGTDDRATILKQIFDTRLYEQIAEILKEDAKAATAARNAATDEIITAIRQVAAVVGIDEEVQDRLLEFAVTRLDDDLRTGLEGLVPPLADEVTSTTAAATAALAALDAADASRARAKAEADAQAGLAQAAERKAEATAGVERARRPLGAMAALSGELGVILDESVDVETWRQRCTTVATAAGALDTLIDREREVLGWPAEQANAQAAIDELQRQEAVDRARQEELPALITAQEAIAAAQPTMAEGAEITRRQQALASARQQYEQLDAQEQRLPGLEQAVREHLAAAEAADAVCDAAARAYRAGIAAELALTLAPDEPCPVCGAAEHPLPAQPDGDHVSADDVETLRQRASDLHATLQGARTTLTAAHEGIGALRLAIPIPRDELPALQQAVDADREALQAREDAADAAARQLTELRAEFKGVSERLATSSSEIVRRSSTLQARAQEMEKAAAQVEAARGSSPSVADRRDDVMSLRDALGTLADRLADLVTATTAYATAERELAALPQHDGFGDVGAAQAAWIEADGRRLAAEGARNAAEQRHAQLTTGIEAIGALCEARVATIAASADLLDLAGLFAAGKGDDVGLHIYVLKSLFATVMEGANLRFEGLLNGRYRLVPEPEGVGDKRSRQGLGVWVEDRRTGAIRSARSLSGGETFCASLALALGLSDVVRMTAGGIEIGSLFIDEGFGSLDNDQLDEVMVMLGHLSSGGRRVGVISHVDSMKSTITERIDVTPVGDDRPTSLTVSWMT